MDDGTQIIVEGDSVRVINTNPVVIYEGTEAELDTDISQKSGEITDLQNAASQKQAELAVLQTYKAKFSA